MDARAAGRPAPTSAGCVNVGACATREALLSGGWAMTNKVSWGVLGVAKIGVEKVIPAMQQGAVSRVDAIASRDIAKAEEAARALGIAKAYGSYEELLADP